jgi:cytochrome b
LRRIKVWDGPIRLFHWLLVALIAAAWWTAEEEMLTWHYRIGFTVLILIVFRLIWGFVGSSTARFAGFVRGPRAIVAYLRGAAPHGIGHNPLGALSVLALLGLVGAVTALGLFASDEDGIEPGPLAYRISVEASDVATELHEKGFDVLLVLVGLHVAAILYYGLFKRDNLLGPMLSGRRDVPEGTGAMRAAPGWRLALALALAFAFAWWVWSGAGL